MSLAAAAGPADGDCVTFPPPTTSVEAHSGRGGPGVVIGRRSEVAGSGGHRVNRPSPVRCQWYTLASGAIGLNLPITRVPSGAFLDKLDPASPAGTAGYRVCVNTQTGASTDAFLQYGGAAPAAPTVTPQMLAQQAAAQLDVGLPEPATSPGLNQFQLAGLPTWLWVQEWDPVSKTATIPLLSATVSARPIRSTWDFGAGGKVICNGPGTPYDFRKAAANQSTDCSLTFTRAGTFPARVTVDWAVSWNATTGAAGTLPTIARTTAFDIEVRSAQAATD